MNDLWWRDKDAEYIRRRSDRYPGATNIDPDWTLEAASDPRRIVHDPDPRSRTGAVRVIGFSPSAGFVITVIATGRAHAGVTAWKAAGRIYGTTRGRVTVGDRDEALRRPARHHDADVAADVHAVREEYADEEAEAAEVEAAGNAAALEVALSLRIDRELDEALKRRAVQEQVSPSALVRRLLRDALRGGNEPVLTARQVEEIARRVMRESA